MGCEFEIFIILSSLKLLAKTETTFRAVPMHFDQAQHTARKPFFHFGSAFFRSSPSQSATCDLGPFERASSLWGWNWAFQDETWGNEAVRSSLLTNNLFGVYQIYQSSFYHKREFTKIGFIWGNTYKIHHTKSWVYSTTLPEDLLSWETKGPIPPMPRFAPRNNKAI